MGAFSALQDEYRAMAPWYDIVWWSYLNKTFQKPLHLVRQSIKKMSHHNRDPANPVTVVDVGCGTGEFLKRLENNDHTSDRRPKEPVTAAFTLYYGIEPSHEMLQRAKQKSHTIHWEEAPAENLPLKDSTVDVVVSTNAFHFVRDRIKALSEMWRILKCTEDSSDDVSLIITDWCADYWLVRLYHFREQLWWEWWKGYQDRYPGPLRGAAMQQLVEEAGFSNVSIETYYVRVFGIIFWGMQTVTASKMK
jgi:ubiquinone/menaquinone biosynthesis C-methylase UbiE